VNCDNCTAPLASDKFTISVQGKNFCNLKCLELYHGLVAKDSISATLAERGSRYGPLKIQAGIEQDLKAIMRATGNWHQLTSDKKTALEMMVLKISRILAGCPEYKDNWHDIQGWAKLIEDGLEEGE